jgi:hypothetical protein
VVVAFWIGIYPKPFFEVLDEPVGRLVQQIEGTYQFPSDVAALNPTPADAGPVVAEAADARIELVH